MFTDWRRDFFGQPSSRLVGAADREQAAASPLEADGFQTVGQRKQRRIGCTEPPKRVGAAGQGAISTVPAKGLVCSRRFQDASCRCL